MKSEFKTVSFPKKPPASRLRFYLMLLVFMIPLTLFFIAGRFGIHEINQQIIDSSVAVEGVLTRVSKKSGKRGYGVAVEYKFVAKNGVEYEGAGYLPESQWSSLKYGMKIRILYDPNSPEKNYLEETTESRALERPFELELMLAVVFSIFPSLLLNIFYLWLTGKFSFFPDPYRRGNS